MLLVFMSYFPYVKKTADITYNFLQHNTSHRMCTEPEVCTCIVLRIWLQRMRQVKLDRVGYDLGVRVSASFNFIARCADWLQDGSACSLTATVGVYGRVDSGRI